MNNLKKILKKIFLVILILFSLLNTLNNRALGYEKEVINQYLYTIEKIYYEDLFTKRELYSLDLVKKYFMDNLEKLGIQDSFKQTIYKFTDDPYLEIKPKSLYESYYYQDRDIKEDIIIERIREDCLKLEICYVKLNKLSANMAKKYRQYLKNEIEPSDLIIIDLTGNMGGSLWSAAFFISMFFNTNTYLFSVNFLTKDKIKTQNFYNSEDYAGLFVNNMVAILQDETTISAAEVISGVLKNRSLIFGDLTYGKPYIQSILETDELIIVYTNAFLNFSLELRPHEKIKPDFYLSQKEIENKKIIELFSKIYFYLTRKMEGG